MSQKIREPTWLIDRKRIVKDTFDISWTEAAAVRERLLWGDCKIKSLGKKKKKYLVEFND